MTYKKIMDIKLNEVTYTIFVNENNKKAFLKKDQNGQYCYPSLKEYLFLNKQFNNCNPFVCHQIKKYVFKEKIQFASIFLAISIAINTAASFFKKYDIKVEGREITLVECIDENDPRLIKINNITELSEYGIEKPSIEEVKKAIDEANISYEYKGKANEIVDYLYSLDSNYDFRIFYENIKSLKITEMSLENLRDYYDQTYGSKSFVNGFYDSRTNEIYFATESGDSVIYHELAHTFNSFARTINNNFIYVANEFGYSLNEAMTNYLINDLTVTYSYELEGQVLEFLLETIDYDIIEYSQYGINGLIKKLTTTYPNIDINYIVSCLDTIKDTEALMGLDFSITNMPELIDELFSLCKEAIKNNNNDIYKPFKSFIKIFKDTNNSELLLSYLDEYNQELMINNYEPTITRDSILDIYNQYKDFNALGSKKNEVIPIIVKYETDDDSYLPIAFPQYYILDNNEEKKVSYYDYNIIEKVDLKYMLIYELIMVHDSINTADFWENLSHDFKVINPAYYEPINITYGSISVNEYLEDMYIEIGINDQNQRGFNLYKNDQLFFRVGQDLKYLSNKVSLLTFLDIIRYQEIDLSLVTSDDFLNYYSSYFNNIYVNKDNEIKFINNYVFIIKNNDTEIKTNIKQCFLTNQDEFNCFINVGILNIIDDPFFGEHQAIIPRYVTLYEVLIYYNLLDENILTYEFTQEEFINLFKNYITETILLNKAR